MTTLYWPRHLLCGVQHSFDPVYRSTSGGAGRAGLGQVVASDAGVWRATIGGIPVLQSNRHNLIILWHAIDGLLGGRIGEIAMPVIVRGRRPLPTGIDDNDIDGEVATPHSDGAEFDDDSGYLNSWISVEIAADAALRATSLSLVKTACGTLSPGQRFSIGTRLYQIKSVVSQTSSTATVVVNFPLREAVFAGTECEFARPVCLMRLATDQEMDLAVELNKRALPTINMVEAV